MPTIVSVSIVVIAAVLVIQTAAILFVALKARRALDAIEVKVYELGDGIDRVKEAVSAAGQFAGVLRSPLVKGLGLALGAATTYYNVRSKRRAAAANAADGD